MNRLRVCLEPGCSELVPIPATRCRAHVRLGRDQGRKKVYASRRWRGMRRTLLKDHPYCQWPGCQNLGQDVDHVLAMAEGGDPWDRKNLQVLCAQHHAAKTAQEVYGRKARQVPITEEIQVWHFNRLWQWRWVNLLTSQVIEESAGTFATPQLAKANALLEHPTVHIAYFWVSEAGDPWHRYQDAQTQNTQPSSSNQGRT